MFILANSTTADWNRKERVIFHGNKETKVIRITKLGNDTACGKATEVKYKNQVNIIIL